MVRTELNTKKFPPIRVDFAAAERMNDDMPGGDKAHTHPKFGFQTVSILAVKTLLLLFLVFYLLFFLQVVVVSPSTRAANYDSVDALPLSAKNRIVFHLFFLHFLSPIRFVLFFIFI